MSCESLLKCSANMIMTGSCTHADEQHAKPAAKTVAEETPTAPRADLPTHVPPSVRKGSPAASLSQLTAAKGSPRVSQGTAKGTGPLSQLGYKVLVPGKGYGLTLLCVEIHAECRSACLLIAFLCC